MYIFEILAENEDVRNFYLERANLEGDAGVDLFLPETIVIPFNSTTSYFLDHKIKCRMLDEQGKQVSYYLYARSSIAKTPLILANSVGIIDSKYRGSIKAAVRFLHQSTEIMDDHEENCSCTFCGWSLEKGTRLVQICAPNLSDIKVRLVNSLDETSRGTGGFGSTGV